jgi:hypothetical protein
MTYRTPSDRERRFLRILAHGHPELEGQVESCEISEYDPTGYYQIRVLGGPPAPQPAHHPIDGPAVTGNPKVPLFTVLLWTDERGLLYSIEILEVRAGGAKEYDAIDPVDIFIDAAQATPSRLLYPTRA